MEKALAYIAGYKMKAVLIGQSLNQLEKAYGEKNSVLDNCNTSVFYAPSPNDDKTPELISKKLGDKTIEVSSSSKKEFSFEGLNISKNKQARKLMTPEETRTLPENRNIIFFGGQFPLKGVKIKYFLEPYFNEKTKINPPKLERIPQEEVILEKKLEPELPKQSKEEIKEDVKVEEKEKIEVTTSDEIEMSDENAKFDENNTLNKKEENV